MVLKYWTNDFARCAYLRPDRPNQVLIQYSGDDTKARQFPHRNSTNSARNFTRTQPSVIASVKEAGVSASGPVSAQRLYQSMVVSGSASATPATSIPRNTRQVKNTLVNQRNKTRPTRDALYNLHEPAYDFDFIQHITTYLSVILHHPDMIELFRSTLSHSTPSDKPMRQLSYDTTFNMGDFYLSVLLFRATGFEFLIYCDAR